MSQHVASPSATHMMPQRIVYSRNDMLSYFRDSLPIHPGLQETLKRMPELTPIFTTEIAPPLVLQEMPMNKPPNPRPEHTPDILHIAVPNMTSAEEYKEFERQLLEQVSTDDLWQTPDTLTTDDDSYVPFISTSKFLEDQEAIEKERRKFHGGSAGSTMHDTSLPSTAPSHTQADPQPSDDLTRIFKGIVLPSSQQAHSAPKDDAATTEERKIPDTDSKKTVLKETSYTTPHTTSQPFTTSYSSDFTYKPSQPNKTPTHSTQSLDPSQFTYSSPKQPHTLPTSTTSSYTSASQSSLSSSPATSPRDDSSNQPVPSSLTYTSLKSSTSSITSTQSSSASSSSAKQQTSSVPTSSTQQQPTQSTQLQPSQQQPTQQTQTQTQTPTPTPAPTTYTTATTTPRPLPVPAAPATIAPLSVHGPRHSLTPTHATPDMLSGKCWIYIDNNGKEQGPFTQKEMHDWNKQHLLPTQLFVRLTSERVYATIPNHWDQQKVPFTDTPLLLAVRMLRGTVLAPPFHNNGYTDDAGALDDPAHPETTEPKPQTPLISLNPAFKFAAITKEDAITETLRRKTRPHPSTLSATLSGALTGTEHPKQQQQGSTTTNTTTTANTTTTSTTPTATTGDTSSAKADTIASTTASGTAALGGQNTAQLYGTSAQTLYTPAAATLQGGYLLPAQYAPLASAIPPEILQKWIQYVLMQNNIKLEQLPPEQQQKTYAQARDQAIKLYLQQQQQQQQRQQYAYQQAQAQTQAQQPGGATGAAGTVTQIAQTQQPATQTQQQSMQPAQTYQTAAGLAKGVYTQAQSDMFWNRPTTTSATTATSTAVAAQPSSSTVTQQQQQQQASPEEQIRAWVATSVRKLVGKEDNELVNELYVARSVEEVRVALTNHHATNEEQINTFVRYFAQVRKLQ